MIKQGVTPKYVRTRYGAWYLKPELWKPRPWTEVGVVNCTHVIICIHVAFTRSSRNRKEERNGSSYKECFTGIHKLIYI